MLGWPAYAVFIALTAKRNRMHSSEMRFYKYMSPDSALSALENGTMKWSSPRLFNDPFDFPSAMDFSFSSGDLAKALADELRRIAYGLEEPAGDVSNSLLSHVLLFRRLEKKSTEEAENILNAFIECAVAEAIKGFEEGQEQRRKLLNRLRNQFAVFCVSAKRDSLLMWAHYAKDHTGCVFQFRCLPGLNSPLIEAKRINYVRSYPLIGSLDGYVKELMTQPTLDLSKLFEAFAFTKSWDWHYEEEWRCITGLRDHTSGFDYNAFMADELEAVYIGHRASKEDKKRMLDVLGKKYPNSKMFSSDVNIQDYSMVFSAYP